MNVSSGVMNTSDCRLFQLRFEEDLGKLPRFRAQRIGVGDWAEQPCSALLQLGRRVPLPDIVAHVFLRVRTRLSAGGKRIRTLSPTRDALDFETVFPLYDGSISRKGSVRALPGLRVRVRLSPGLRQQRTGARRSHHEAQTKDSAGWVVAFDTSKLANGSAMANAWCSDPADGSGSGGGAGVWMANAAPPSTKTAISTW